MIMDIPKIKEKLSKINGQITQIAGSLKSNTEAIFYPNNVMILPSSNLSSLGMKIAAVDSGFVSRNFFGMDLMLIRPAGTIFNYDNSKLLDAESVPKRPKINYAFNGSNEPAVDSLTRLGYELSLAINILKRDDVKVLLFDGSLLPLPADVIPESSPNFEKYKNVLNLVTELMSYTTMGKIVIGVVKDSKSTKISKKLDVNVRDILIIDKILNENEYTGYISVDEGKLKDFKWSKEIVASYLRPLSNDLPLRIEFNRSQIDEVIPLMFTLCKFSNMHAYPPPLIEADLRAAFSSKEINQHFSHIQNILGLKSMRRYSRPFK